MSASESPTALISYSWDSEEHKVWVRGISERLRKNGVDVKLDQWHVRPGQSLTQFMEKEIVDCDYVLIICTPNYYQKSIERQGGVGYEQQIISGHIASGVPRDKFIPIVRAGEIEPGENCSVPPHFSGIFAVDMRGDEGIDTSLEQLLRTVFGESIHPVPKIGEKPIWDALKNGDEAFSDMRLAARDLDGWELRSGLAQNHRTPKSFYMPSEDDRRNLQEGDNVKLIFGIDVPPDEGEQENVFFERMWVLVRDRIGPYYVGDLNNVPLTASVGEQDFLTPGSEVIFLPEHVIEISTN
ncbi:MAG: toll/interleukin-1 receptor domain-containing protein [Gammaproteobacteria bacterium]|nr:toll/interleukin-1 receptor domain-containing protein [Gammaproteobacteria bacterium]